MQKICAVRAICVPLSHQSQHLSKLFRILTIIPNIKYQYGITNNRIHHRNLLHMKNPHLIATIIEIPAADTYTGKDLQLRHPLQKVTIKLSQSNQTELGVYIFHFGIE